jgi:very-short-patch-repair endonuclease
LEYYVEERHAPAAKLWIHLGGSGDLRPTIKRALGLVQSPIEADMLAFLCAQPHLRVLSWAESQSEEDPFGEYQGMIIPQGRVGKYRADILIVLGLENGGLKMLAVECDGYEYHDRNRWTAQKDKKRDRYFATQGVTVLRFTGSEIFKNPMACAGEVLKTILDAHKNVSEGVH